MVMMIIKSLPPDPFHIMQHSSDIIGWWVSMRPLMFMHICSWILSSNNDLLPFLQQHFWTDSFIYPWGKWMCHGSTLHVCNRLFNRTGDSLEWHTWHMWTIDEDISGRADRYEPGQVHPAGSQTFDMWCTLKTVQYMYRGNPHITYDCQLEI